MLPGPSLSAQAKGVPAGSGMITKSHPPNCAAAFCAPRTPPFDHFRNIVHPEVKMHLVLLLSGLGGTKIVRFLRKQESRTGGAADSRPAERPAHFPTSSPP